MEARQDTALEGTAKTLKSEWRSPQINRLDIQRTMFGASGSDDGIVPGTGLG